MTDETELWRTLVDPAHAAAFGCDTELHAVFFEANDDNPGLCAAVAVQIPEISDVQLAVAMQRATQMRARVLFLCDTREQADEIAARASGMLHAHHRVSYERAEAGEWGIM